MSALTLVSAVARRIAGPYRRRIGPDTVFGVHAGGASEAQLDRLREEVEQLRTELAAVQDRLAQVDEMQERLDFAERVLAQAREKQALPGER